MHSAVFLDRDGVIIENRSDYVRSLEDVRVIPGALEALCALAAGDCKVVIITNQSVVGRGFISLEEAQQINDRLLEVILQAGGRVDGVYMCPHAPQAGCACRKPRPGLIHQAARELDLDLERSVLIGDALTDMRAAATAGIPRRVLVLTGRGAEQLAGGPGGRSKPTDIFPDLAQAVMAILSEARHSPGTA